jgi:autotransporter-associated beta strand protein
MRMNQRGVAAVRLAAFAGLVTVVGTHSLAWGQQNPADPTVFLTTGDANSTTATSLTSGGNWGASSDGLLSANTAPTSGYAYVDTGYQIRTPANSTSYTFGGDSLTIIPATPIGYLATASNGIAGASDQSGGGAIAYFTPKGNGSSSATATANVTTVNDLVLANGGAFCNFANDNQTLAGNIYLVPVGVTLDGITTTVPGGIIDTHGDNQSGAPGGGINLNTTAVTANISGGGSLRLVNTGGGTSGSLYYNQSLLLSGNNSFTGGVILDGTSTFSSPYGNGPDVLIDSVTALGTGPFTILPNPSAASGSPGVQIDNTTGATEVLTTQNPQFWYGNFTFLGSNSLEMGGGTTTLEANVSLNVASHTLTEDGPITGGGYSLTKTGGGTLMLTGALSFTGGLNVSAGTVSLTWTGSNLSGGTIIVDSGAILTLPAAISAGQTNIGVLAVGGLTNSGLIDIGKTALDIQNAGTSGLQSITSEIAAGYNLINGANWQGAAGITSSAAASDSTHLHAIGVLYNTTAQGQQIYGAGTAFDGTNPGGSDVLVKYTWFGDANLDGVVDGSDYSLIDAGYASQQPGFTGTVLSGWSNGDFNYDGVIDGSDYALIDNAFNNQGQSLSSSALVAATASVVSPAAVPEPVSLGTIALATYGLVTRRRRK